MFFLKKKKLRDSGTARPAATKEFEREGTEGTEEQALHRNPPEWLIFAKILPRMAG
jgi:hypothetical protein